MGAPSASKSPSALISARGLDNIVKIKFDYGKEDGVGDLLLVRQPLFADLCLKVVDTVSKIAI